MQTHDSEELLINGNPTSLVSSLLMFPKSRSKRLLITAVRDSCFAHMWYGRKGYRHNFLNSRQVWSSFHAPSSYGANHTTVSCQAAPGANYLNSIVHKMTLDTMSTAGLAVLPPCAIRSHPEQHLVRGRGRRDTALPHH